MAAKLSNFTDVLGDAEQISDSQVSLPLSFSSSIENHTEGKIHISSNKSSIRPSKGTGQYNEFRSVDEIDPKYRDVFAYPFFNLVQSRVIEDALYSDKSLVVCAPTGSGKTVVFEMAVVQLLMEIEDNNIKEDFKIIYMAPVKALCTERLTEWYSKFTKLGLLCIEVTGDTDVDFTQLQAYRIIITTPEKWDMLTRRWRDHRGLVEMIKLFLIDEVHILNDESRGPVLEAVVSRMKTIQASAQSAHRIEKLQKQYQNMSENGIIDLSENSDSCPRIRFVAVSATVSNPEDVAAWLGTNEKPAVYYRFGDECRPVKMRRVVEGYPCSEGTSIFKFDIILNYKLWPIIQKYHDGKPTLIFCNTRKSVLLTAETLSREITVTFSAEQKAKLTALASTIKTKKFQSLVLAGVGCHHAGMLFEERTYIEHAFRNGHLPILITTTTLAMGVNLPAHLVIIKNTQQYVNGAYQEYSISTVLQMVGRAGRPQFDTEATAVIMTRQKDKMMKGRGLLLLEKAMAARSNESECNLVEFKPQECTPSPITSTSVIKIATISEPVGSDTELELHENTPSSEAPSTSPSIMREILPNEPEGTDMEIELQQYKPTSSTNTQVIEQILANHDGVLGENSKSPQSASARSQARYQALAGGSEPLQSYLHKRLAENLNSETALGTVGDVAQCVEWLRSTFLFVRAAKDPKRYLGLTAAAPDHLILKKVEELCVIAMNGLASAGLITMDDASCISSTEAGQLMSLYYLDLETMKHIMTIQGNESLERLVWIICECHELADMYLRTDERRILNALNRNNTGAAIRFPMKGKITTRQMKLSCIIQAILGCLPIPDPPLNQEAMKIMRIADRICKCLVAYVTRPGPLTEQRQYFAAVLNSVILAKCVSSHLWENSPYVSKQLKGIGPTFSTLLASAGKVNFMLLEESHPRDLERIMNKGPPAGNVLRKQISLLPKYQLLATPVDEKTVSVKLQLLNQAYLADNVEDLTAGKTHKCYLIAGDSENHILMLRTFTDKDLISVYDGGVMCEITRKHGFEHKIFAHCISSKFAGIDVQCEYTFQNLMTPGPQNVDTSSVFFNKQTPETTYKQAKKQTTITDTFRERKRKNCNDEIVQSKEKKKRENALAEKFRLLKESFGRTSTNLREDLQKTQEISNIVLNDLTDKSEAFGNSIFDHDNDASNINLTDNFNELHPDIDITDGSMYDANIDSILNEIESEITKKNITTKKPLYKHNAEITVTKSNNENNIHQTTLKKKTGQVQKKTNYNFLDLLEKNIEISDEEDLPKKTTGFSDTIKSQIEKYLLQSSKGPIHTEAFAIKELCEKEEEAPVPLNIISTEKPEVSLSNSITPRFINLPESISIEDITSEREILFDNTKKYKNTADENINFSSDPDNVTILEDGTYNFNQENNYNLEKEESIREKEQNDDIEFLYKKLNYNLQGESNVNTGIISIEDEEPSFDKSYKLTNQDLPQVSLNNIRTNIALPVTLDEMNTPLAQPWQVQDLKLVPTKEMPSLLSSNLSLPPIPKMPTLPVTSPGTSFVHLYNITTSFSKNPQSSTALNKMAGWQLANQRMPILDTELTNVFDNNSSISRGQDVQNSTFNAATDKLSRYVMKMSSHQDDPSNKLELDNKGAKKYKESYKFSAEKVDIHTEFTNDHQIHVIRRLKLDLDVKKIVSSLGNKKCFNTESTAEKQTENKCDESRDEWELGNEQHTTLSKDNYKITSNEPVDSICHNEHKQLKKPYEMKNMELVTDNMYNNSVLTNVNVENENRTHIDPTHIAKENNVSNNSYGNSVQTNVNVDNENRTHIDHTHIAKKNNVSNILLKFSRIMGKNKSSLSKVPIYQNMSSNCTTKTKPFKSRRPFRIKEIQNIDVPLPTLCEGFKTINNGNNVQETYASDLNPVVSHFSRRTAIAELVSDFTNQDFEQQSCEQPQEYFRLTPCPSPEPLLEQVLEISEDDLKLDQSMLNPKTMLQCIKPDDDTIIPPPPEFGDNDYSYSYSPDRTHDFEKDLITQPYLYEERVHDKSIFDGDCQSGLDLTPSKEIETWALSRDDEFKSCLLKTPEQFNTVMHRKMLQNQFEKPFLNSFHGRQGQLSAFKFKRKSKLKM